MTEPTVVPLDLDDSLNVPLAAAIGVEADVVTVSRDGHGVLCLDVPPSAWPGAATFLRDRCGLDFFDWLSAVDQPDADPPGVDVVLHVADSHVRPAADGSDRRVRRALLRTRVPNAPGTLASLTGVWPGVAWHERETFEMFGLTFEGFEDGQGSLRPLLLPDGFEGNPLRKSFLLAARASKPWPGAKEPGESDAGGAPSRRKTLPPGVPEPGFWGREPGTPPPAPAADAGGPPGRGARPARTPRTPRTPRAPRTEEGSAE